MDEQFDLVDLVVDRESSITATFADGHVATFALDALRLSCPCATCRDLRDRGNVSWPGSGAAMPLAVADARLHGAWGVNVTWSDGHSTGIYTFEYLRRLSDGGSPPR